MEDRELRAEEKTMEIMWFTDTGSTYQEFSGELKPGTHYVFFSIQSNQLNENKKQSSGPVGAAVLRPNVSTAISVTELLYSDRRTPLPGRTL